MKIQKYIKSIAKKKEIAMNTPISTSNNSVSCQQESSKKSDNQIESYNKGGPSELNSHAEEDQDINNDEFCEEMEKGDFIIPRFNSGLTDGAADADATPSISEKADLLFDSS